ncbi:ATP synthase F1 subunit gamma [Roseivirga sp. BDSF3-8]|uniref:ATP synthase F1 subunit gamma n=1 Tax=Roseivirga sp. BDSF3-8 TaxID=3241598 RepID=UPI003531C521
MANLKEVKSRIQSVSSTQQITKAMKMVAAAKLRRAQDNIIQMRPYAEKLSAILQNVSASVGEGADSNEYGEEREPKKVLIIAVSSDKGLCGAFNANINRRITQLASERYASQRSQGNLYILPVGKKVYDFIKRRDFQVIETYKDTFSNLSFDSSREIAEYAMEGFKKGEFDRVELLFNEFKNVATQIVRTEQWLPIPKAEHTEDAVSTTKVDYIYEPSKEYIIRELIPTSLKIQLYKALLESNASEHGARMTAMDKATDNAGELLKDLKLMYNRTRQAAITNEILEIVAGAEALGSN